MTSTAPEKGLVVGGRYRLTELLGEGGMAVVWRATHTETDRVVALKLVRRELAQEQQARELFVREARIAARIGRSDHIVDVLDAGIDEGLNVPFLVMELLEGEPLDERLRREGPLSAEMGRELLFQLADALDQAHGASVIHRDLKPQNLFLTKTKRGEFCVKVLDFGIAKIAETAQQSSTQVGTPAYSAPEQLGPTWRALAERNGKVIATQVGRTTDVWAMGLVAYEVFTGARSGDFWGATTLAELPVKMVLEPLPAATARAGNRAGFLPPGFDAWLARCLDIDATQRWPTAGEAVQALYGPGTSDAPGAGPPPAGAPAAYAAPVAAAAIAAAPLGANPPAAYPAPPAPPPHAGHVGVTPHGGWANAPGFHLDPALAQWAEARRVAVSPGGDARAYQAWHPFQFVPSIGSVRMEARTTLHDATILIADILTADDLKRALGEGNIVLTLVTSNRVRCRAALRPRQSVGIGDSLSRGFQALDDFMGSAPKGTPSIGDPWFEARYEVRAPSPQEGHHALPYPLRQFLAHTGFPGILELRPGGFVVAFLERRFEPALLDQTLGLVDRVLSTANG